jgi:hypothetical protein
MLTIPLTTLSSIVFHVTPNGPPKGPEPPTRLMPPLTLLKWIWTEAAFVACTPPEIVPVCAGFSAPQHEGRARLDVEAALDCHWAFEAHAGRICGHDDALVGARCERVRAPRRLRSASQRRHRRSEYRNRRHP